MLILWRKGKGRRKEAPACLRYVCACVLGDPLTCSLDRDGRRRGSFFLLPPLTNVFSLAPHDLQHEKCFHISCTLKNTIAQHIYFATFLPHKGLNSRAALRAPKATEEMEGMLHAWMVTMTTRVCVCGEREGRRLGSSHARQSSSNRSRISYM